MALAVVPVIARAVAPVGRAVVLADPSAALVDLVVPVARVDPAVDVARRVYAAFVSTTTTIVG